jgi:hypothetical protein
MEGLQGASKHRREGKQLVKLKCQGWRNLQNIISLEFFLKKLQLLTSNVPNSANNVCEWLRNC